MSFTRYHDDPCRIIKQLQQSTDPGRYVLNVPGNNGDEPVYIQDPCVRLQKWGANLRTDAIAIESELRGLSRTLTRDTHVNEYRGEHAMTASAGSQVAGNYVASRPFTDQTRATHPAWAFRDLEHPNWDYLHMDPQENVFMNFQNNLSTRILEKDHYVPAPK